MLDLKKGARPDEIFHLQAGQPTFTQTVRWGYRKTVWGNIFLPDGSPGTFVSIWIGKLQFYRGTCKCDPTRTQYYWDGTLDDGQAPAYTPDKALYVMTTTPKEMLALRWRKDGPRPAEWTNMGGS